MAERRVLHLLAQRPGRTGSGVTLEALVGEARRAGWVQHAVVGVPAGEAPQVSGLASAFVHPLEFGDDRLPFPVPGMSDVMPYPSTRFSSMDDATWQAYADAWRAHLAVVAEIARPDVVHAHHAWVLASIVKDVLPEVPVVTHCHSTGLRQMELCVPDRVREVQERLARNEVFAALHGGDAARLVEKLEVEPARVRTVGAGYREDVFHARGRDAEAETLVYVGKLSAAKGLLPLLDAVERLARTRPGVRLHISGAGAGDEADAIRARIGTLAPTVVYHGRLDQPQLVELLRSSSALVLPSFYEGLPLVLVEAAACGCRVVATDLPGVRDPLAAGLGDLLEVVALPEMESVDRPRAEALPGFVDRLVAALDATLARPEARPRNLETFTWGAVFARVERLWLEQLGG